MDTTLIIILLTVLLLGIILAFTFYANRKRREALKLVAQEMSFRFTENDTLGEEINRKSFALFSIGHAKHVRNELSGKGRESEVRLFDYTYTTGTGKHQSTSIQTVALFTLECQTLPEFQVKPEGFFDRVAEKMGRVDIDFAEDEEFSKRFQLTGADELALKSLFGMAVRRWFLDHQGFSAEARDECLLVFRKNRQVKPAELRQFFSDCTQLLDYLRRPTILM